MKHSQKSFFTALFDFSFEEFVTIRIVKVLFALAILGSAAAALTFVIFAFQAGGVLAGLASLVVAPLFFLIYVLMSRVGLEVIMVLFRIAENTAEDEKPSS